MRKITVISMITLDGVMQAPGGPGEDKSGGFEYGGWSAPFGDEASGKIMQRLMEPKTFFWAGRHLRSGRITGQTIQNSGQPLTMSPSM
jgi:hypothetical protein